MNIESILNHANLALLNLPSPEYAPAKALPLLEAAIVHGARVEFHNYGYAVVSIGKGEDEVAFCVSCYTQDGSWELGWI
jgi:hypothetical protein